MNFAKQSRTQHWARLRHATERPDQLDLAVSVVPVSAAIQIGPTQREVSECLATIDHPKVGRERSLDLVAVRESEKRAIKHAKAEARWDALDRRVLLWARNGIDVWAPRPSGISRALLADWGPDPDAVRAMNVRQAASVFKVTPKIAEAFLSEIAR